MHINEELTWDDVGNISTGSGTVKDAFSSKYARKELLNTGTSLYKFNGYSSLGRGKITDTTVLSPWWSPTEAFQYDAGLSERRKIAELNGISFREWGRLTSVIKENWSTLSWLLTIELKIPVYAWFGGFQGMSRIDSGATSKRDSKVESKGRSKNLPGGGTQFYIPNLKLGSIRIYKFDPI
ncbi:hypothetical protein [Endozoicomonas sp.]|uniref:hypothetical protein n=1 Tax=Endozoicomonas sp. TaxID=1892382 RepID=UPI0028877D77|nr:hypothetical protein [Endozoicomonas sp.]